MRDQIDNQNNAINNQNNVGNMSDIPTSTFNKREIKKRFTYKVKDKNNKIINDYYDTVSIEDAKNYLESQGYQIIKIKEDKLSSKLGIANSSKEMKAKDISFFLTQLSTYIKSGIPLAEAMNILSRQTKKKNIKRSYSQIVFELYKGVSFSRCLSMQGKTFPRMLVNMVQTSELTGNLTEVLDEMASYYKKKDSNRKQIISALTYPTVILIFAICILAFVIMYIVPEFTSMYASIDSELPKITQVIVGISDFVIQQKFIILIAILGIILLFNALYRNVTSFRYIVQWILMHIPVIKDIIINNEIIMFTSTFSSLLKYDVFITDSMEILGKISNNEIFKMLIKDSVINLSNGEGLAPAFKGHWAFPSIAYEMLLTGEKTGKLGPMMGQVASYYQDEQTNIISRLKSLIEPVMIILLAVLVGIILISVVLPMFTIYSEMI